ncbi:hypothetical protein HDU96_001202 [Phlyctochytrium bullatum]|nr:hypothetical protein HDU96_001202 [Phlyctochytrium bullatum]
MLVVVFLSLGETVYGANADEYLPSRTDVPKPLHFDAKRARLAAHFTPMMQNIDVIEERAPGAKQFLIDAIEGEEKIDLFIGSLLNQTRAPIPRPGGGLVRRQKTGNGFVSAQVVSQLSTFAQFSTLAYCDLGALSSWSCGGCYDAKVSGTRNVRTFFASSTQMQGYVGISDRYQTIVVAFRGSKNFENWLKNLQFLKADLTLPGAASDVRVHSGFYDVWNSVKNDVNNFIREKLSEAPGYSVTFVGHSLGGATTTLAAVDAVASGFLPRWKVSIYTQGSPRVGNRNFYNYVVNQLGITQYRGVNYNDAVQYLPPTLFNFNHIQQLHWMNGFDQVTYCNDVTSSGEDTNCGNSEFPWVSTSAHLLYFGVNMGGLAC